MLRHSGKSNIRHDTLKYLRADGVSNETFCILQKSKTNICLKIVNSSLYNQQKTNHINFKSREIFYAKCRREI